MAKAKKKTNAPLAPAPAPATVAADAAKKPTTPKTGAKNPLGSLTALQRDTLELTINAFGAVGVAEWKCAEMVGRMMATGAHLANGYSDFAAWLSDATDGRITRSAAGRYSQAAQTLQACESDAEATEAARSVSIDTLSRIAGHAKKSSKTPEGRAVNARRAVKTYAAARKAGKTAPQAAEEAGFGKSASAPDAVDPTAAAERIARAALSLADRLAGGEGNFAEALRILDNARTRLIAMREKAKEIAGA